SARLVARHFAHMYISGIPRNRLTILRGHLDTPFEGSRHDRAVAAPREDVPAPAAGPHPGRRPAHRDRRTPRAHVSVLQALLDLLHPAADPHTVSGPESGDTA